jgi:adenylate kinase
MSRFVVLFGPPGCGKGTQAARLTGALKIVHISTGDMFRDHGKRQTDIGKRAKAIMDRGELVPDSITNEMVEERLGRADVKAGALLDGYPRNVGQAEVLDGLLKRAKAKVDDVVVIDVPEDELVRRIIDRGKQSGRADDQDPKVAKGRLETYRSQSEPCVGFYKKSGKRVHQIDGVGSIDDVTKRILAALGVKG